MIFKLPNVLFYAKEAQGESVSCEPSVQDELTWEVILIPAERTRRELGKGKAAAWIEKRVEQNITACTVPQTWLGVVW